MSSPSKSDFTDLVMNTKGLGIAGLFSDSSFFRYKVDPVKNQHFLLDRFDEFRLCCTMLSDSQQCQVTQESPSSYILHRFLERRCGHDLSIGAVIAAVIYRGMPYQHITNTPDIRVGISRHSSIFQSNQE